MREHGKPGINIRNGVSTFNWSMLGFGICRASFLFCFVFTSAYYCIVPNALITYWISATGAAVTLSLIALKTNRLQALHDDALAVGAFTSLGGILAMIYGNYIGVLPLALAGVIASGCGCALVFILWGYKLSQLPERKIILYVVLGMALAGCILLVVNLLGDFSGISALFFALIALFTLRDDTSETRRDEAPSEIRDDNTPGLVTDKPLGISHNLFAKLCLMMFIIPFAYHLAVMTFISTTILNRDIEGVNVAGLSLLIIFLATRIKVISIFRIVLPVIIGAYLFMQLLPVQYAPICTIIAGSGLKLSEVFIWILLITTAHDLPERRWPIIGWGVAAMFAGRSVAFLLASALSSFDGYNPTLIVYLLVVILVVAVILVLPEGQSHADHTEQLEPAMKEQPAVSIPAVCAKIASTNKLTEREAEILLLLAQGRSQSIIADKLSITEGTAHVHITHIYQKLGIHSQQEIITLVEKMIEVHP